MTGDDVCRVLEPMRPQDEMDRLCQECGVIARQRQLHLGMWVRALVRSAGTPGGAYQADVLRSSLACEGPPVTRAAFYRWFDTPRAPCMAALAERALAYAQAPPVELPGPRSGVKAWYSVDATTGRVRDALMEDVRGTGASAALKGQTVRSGGWGAPGRSHCRPAREHDSPQRPLDASGRGDGRLADLASARLARLRACETSEVRCVRRRPDHWQPKVDSLARGQVTRACCPGTDLEALRAAATLVRDGRVIDAEVQGGGGTHPRQLRLVGVQTCKGDGCCLTHLPPRVGPRQVADLYRVRWAVELSRKLDTSVHRLDAIDAARPCALKTLLQASLIASMLAALLAHTHHLQTRPTPVGAPWHRSTPGSWPCSWPSPVRPSPRPSIGTEPRPHNAGTRSQRGAHMPGEIPTGHVGRPSSIRCEVGNASRLLERKTVRTVHRWQLK